MNKNDLPDIFKGAAPLNEDAELLSRKAAAVLADLTTQYPEWTKVELVNMSEMLVAAEQLSGEELFHLMRDDFFQKAHDIKGQGATFDYPLMTEVGSFVCEHLRHKTEVTRADVCLMREMVDIMHQIIDDKIVGDGGAVGDSIRARLTKGQE